MPLTMGIKHRADCGFRKFWILSKLSLGGQVNKPEMPYVSYPRRYVQAPFPNEFEQYPTPKPVNSINIE